MVYMMCGGRVSSLLLVRAVHLRGGKIGPRVLLCCCCVRLLCAVCRLAGGMVCMMCEGRVSSLLLVRAVHLRGGKIGLRVLLCCCCV